MQTELREATQQERDNHFLKVKSDIIQDIFKSIKEGTWSFDEDEPCSFGYAIRKRAV